MGNWISHRLVERLGKQSLISKEFTPPEVVEVSGGPVNACGVIDLEWKWLPKGTRNHVGQFYVLPQSSHLDVVFGSDYIESEKLIQVIESAFVTLWKHNNVTGESALFFQSQVSPLHHISYIH